MPSLNFKKIILYFALTGLILCIWNLWQQEHIALVPNLEKDKSAQSTVYSATTQNAQPLNKPIPDNRVVHVQTDVLDVKIDTNGGDIVQVNLPAYRKELKATATPIQILTSSPEKFYISQSGLLNKNGSQEIVQYSSEKSAYILEQNQQKLRIVLKGCSESHICVSKSYEFARDQYAVQIGQTISNTASDVWVGQAYGQIQFIKPPKINSTGLFGLNTYVGAAYYTPNKPYTKLPYDLMAEKNLDEVVNGGWIALQQRYFLSAWIPSGLEENHYFSHVATNGMHTLGYFGPLVELKPGEQKTVTAKFYVGPESSDRLKPLAKGLDLTLDYGWLWIISAGIFSAMRFIYNYVGNWGWSIILITLLIKIIFFKLSETSYRSMAKMKRMQPRIAALKERYGNDKQELSKATVELYRKEKINPLGGCLPFIVQIPVFIALYYVLIESVELRHAPFLLWIQDLSSKDPYFILPVLMGISMLIQQRLNPPPADPVQAKVMMMLPVIFTVFFIGFPSGLVLYWIVNNCLSIIQQWYITSRIEKNYSQQKNVRK